MKMVERTRTVADIERIRRFESALEIKFGRRDGLGEIAPLRQMRCDGRR